MDLNLSHGKSKLTSWDLRSWREPVWKRQKVMVASWFYSQLLPYITPHITRYEMPPWLNACVNTNTFWGCKVHRSWKSWEQLKLFSVFSAALIMFGSINLLSAPVQEHPHLSQKTKSSTKYFSFAEDMAVEGDSIVAECSHFFSTTLHLDDFVLKTFHFTDGSL